MQCGNKLLYNGHSLKLNYNHRIKHLYLRNRRNKILDPGYI